MPDPGYKKQYTIILIVRGQNEHRNVLCTSKKRGKQGKFKNKKKKKMKQQHNKRYTIIQQYKMHF